MVTVDAGTTVAAHNVTATITGGNKASAFLARIATRLGNLQTVRVGFLENARYPDSDTKRFLKGLRVAQGKSKRLPKNTKVSIVKGLPVAQVAFWNNFGTSRSKPRRFFSNMIEDQSPTWPAKMAAAAKKTDYDAKATLVIVGTDIKDHLVTAIKQWPADNAKLTIAIKGFNKGLVDQGIMQRSVDFEVKT